MQKGAIAVCRASHLIDDPEVCPDAVMHYSPVLFHAVSGYLLGKDRWCNEIL